jgi:hypothetical protein
MRLLLDLEVSFLSALLDAASACFADFFLAIVNFVLSKTKCGDEIL